jgi:protein involved in polysaccharide export with SLBB domain
MLNYISVDNQMADVKAIHVRRASVAAAQKSSIDDSLHRLERSSLLALSASNGESNIRVKEAELTLQFVERARLIQPLGRVVTSRQGVQQNLLLQDGDIVVIPARSNVVRVSGEVMMAQAVVHRPGADAEDYLADAGGLTDRGDSDRVIVIRPNAEVVIGDASTPVFPGDEVLVPPKVDSKVLQNISDITTVMFQLAVSAAVIVAFATL